ncbi:hypothetical protein BDR03DRAFT_987265 [Suillus americanus]|nr:hypothetical protein BDR03DRAFT_987265 [Suillus americanus]
MAVGLKPFFMPLATSSLALHFNGDLHQLPAFLDEVDQLCNKAGLPEKACIKAAIRYVDPIDADIWRHTPESNGNDFEKFANTILHYYPGCTLGHFKCAIPKDLATSDASDPTPYPCELISPPVNLCAPGIQDVSSINSKNSVPTVAAPILEEITPPVPQSIIKSDPLLNLTPNPTQDTSNLMLPDQSLIFENPLITDDTDFCNSSKTHSRDGDLSAESPVNCLEHSSDIDVTPLDYLRVTKDPMHLHAEVAIDLLLETSISPDSCELLSRSNLPIDAPPIENSLITQDTNPVIPDTFDLWT